MKVFEKGKLFSQYFPLVFFAFVSSLFTPLAARGEGVLLKYRGEVLEETDEYVILKLRKADIDLIRNHPELGEQRKLVPEDRRKPVNFQRDVVNQIKAELKTELKADIRGELKKQGVKTEFGSVKGRILSRGIGLANYRVKLVRLTHSSIFKDFKKGLEFETVTDKDGRYVFHEIPTGDYQMQWLSHGSRGWIRRLTERPDVTVEKDQTFHAKDIDMGRPVIEG